MTSLAGLNLPARTVVFSQPTKFDGDVIRGLRPTEYAQHKALPQREA